MTKLLEKAFEEAAKLPQDAQDSLAKFLLEELASDRKWDRLFSESWSGCVCVERRSDVYGLQVGGSAAAGSPLPTNPTPKWQTPYMRCWPFDEDGRKIGDDQECPLYETTIIQLLARPEGFDGKRVRVQGFVHLEFEGNGLYINRQDYGDGLTRNGLWVGGFREGARVRDCQDRIVTLEGTFLAQDYGHMGLWSGSIEDVSKCLAW